MMLHAALVGNLIPEGLFDWIPTVVAAVLGVVGGILLLISVGLLFQTLWLLCCGRRVIATVAGYRNEEEEFHHHRDDAPRVGDRTTSVTFHTPVFTFDDENGQTHEVEGMGNMKKRLQKGDQVVLIYSPRNPKRCVVDDFVNKWVPALIAFFIAVIISLFPAFMLFSWVAD